MVLDEGSALRKPLVDFALALGHLSRNRGAGAARGPGRSTVLGHRRAQLRICIRRTTSCIRRHGARNFRLSRPYQLNVNQESARCAMGADIHLHIEYDVSGRSNRFVDPLRDLHEQQNVRCLPSCRKLQRKDQSIAEFRCPHCGAPCICVHWKLHVPAPKKRKKWNAFWAQYLLELRQLESFRSGDGPDVSRCRCSISGGFADDRCQKPRRNLLGTRSTSSSLGDDSPAGFAVTSAFHRRRGRWCSAPRLRSRATP